MVNYASKPTLDQTFGALADPTRRAMLAHLREGPKTVRELGAPFAVSAPAISKHLRVLEERGLVRRRRVGRHHHVSLEPAPLAHAERWLAAYRQFWEERLDALDAHLQEREEPHDPT